MNGGLLSVVVLLLVALIVVALVKAFQNANAGFEARINAVNQQNSLTFPTTPVLGTWTKGLVFDRTNRKVLYLIKGTTEVLDYSYFTKWIYRWDTRRNGHVDNRRMVLDTTDFDRPQMEFWVVSDHAGQEWMARLDVLFNRE